MKIECEVQTFKPKMKKMSFEVCHTTHLPGGGTVTTLPKAVDIMIPDYGSMLRATGPRIRKMKGKERKQMKSGREKQSSGKLVVIDVDRLGRREIMRLRRQIRRGSGPVTVREPKTYEENYENWLRRQV